MKRTYYPVIGDKIVDEFDDMSMKQESTLQSMGCTGVYAVWGVDEELNYYCFKKRIWDFNINKNQRDLTDWG